VLIPGSPAGFFVRASSVIAGFGIYGDVVVAMVADRDWCDARRAMNIRGETSKIAHTVRETRWRTKTPRFSHPKQHRRGQMKKLATAAAIAALLGVSASASAWWGGGPGGWGGPWGGNSGNDWWNDMMGDGYGDFNMNMSGGGHGSGRGYNRYRN
jgi:hypothetical protein